MSRGFVTTARGLRPVVVAVIMTSVCQAKPQKPPACMAACWKQERACEAGRVTTGGRYLVGCAYDSRCFAACSKTWTLRPPVSRNKRILY